MNLISLLNGSDPLDYSSLLEILEEEEERNSAVKRVNVTGERLKSAAKAVLKGPLRYSNDYGADFSISPEGMEEKLKVISEDSRYLQEYAIELSRRRKRPIMVLCNARSGTLLYHPILNSVERFEGLEESEGFAKEVSSNPKWKKAKGKRKTLFEAAEKWLREGKLDAFLHSTRQIKVSSYRYGNPKHPVMREPFDMKELLDAGIDLVFADYSVNAFPGSFSSAHGTLSYPGFMEYVRRKSSKYTILISSRKHASEAESPEYAIEKASKTPGPVAICLNVLRPTIDGTDLYSFLNNKASLLGEFGYVLGENHADRLKIFKPAIVETTEGSMELGDFVRYRLEAEKASQKQMLVCA